MILLEQLLTDTSNKASFLGLFAKESYGFDHWFSELIMLPQLTIISDSLSSRQARIIEPFKLHLKHCSSGRRGIADLKNNNGT